MPKRRGSKKRFNRREAEFQSQQRQEILSIEKEQCDTSNSQTEHRRLILATIGQTKGPTHKAEKKAKPYELGQQSDITLVQQRGRTTATLTSGDKNLSASKGRCARDPGDSIKGPYPTKLAMDATDARYQTGCNSTDADNERSLRTCNERQTLYRQSTHWRSC